ncbi:BamA/TamA family outer membrane protein [Pedobacter sp. HMF7647]|uniref:BamA/TamA family outer membrane protein n=1 Tax=Hufsiella arboris TaxID=2695275 RepID=A0A7K1Y998_9SPHI|nr:BamA/TamA family outer membrane protein [Hufsiella arboris]MXV51157.1 BamA/TamA family outer membrane protein [Hufsiella arboris]
MKSSAVCILTLIVFALIVLMQRTAIAQEKHKISFKDSLDGAFDLSDYMINAHGFIAVPTIITEPALGGIGGALIPVFLKPVPPVIDSVNGKLRISPQPPDITGGIGMYTANNSWMAGAFRSGTFQKARIRYRIFAGYGDINMSFYKNLPIVGDQEFKLNLKTIPVYLLVLKQFNNIKWSAGLQYMLVNTKVAPDGGNLPDFVKNKEINSMVSQLGGQIQYDNRDNIFTPDKGIRVETDFFWSDKVLGSDYNSWLINYSGIGYTPIAKKLTGGLRIEGAQAINDPPFYLKPFVNLRGVPTMRYQGNATLLSEAEFRWDLYRRWSAVFYGGIAEAYDKWSEMFDDPLVYSYGTGFRYLIARKFKLRMGVDVARGPEDWAYYVVFGSSWFR